MVQEMKNCLLLCLKLFIWDRECVEEMGPNDLVYLIAFTELRNNLEIANGAAHGDG